MRHDSLARRLVAIIGIAALLPPAPLHAAGAPLPEPGAPGAANPPLEQAQEAAKIEAGRTTPLEADTLRPATLDLRADSISRTPAPRSANEIARIPLSAYENLPDPDAQWLSVAARPAEMTTPSWLGLRDSRLLPSRQLSIAKEPSMSEPAFQASRNDSANPAIAAMVVAAAMLGMVAVAVGAAVLQAEVLSD